MRVRESQGETFLSYCFASFRGYVFCFLVGSLLFEKMLNPWEGELMRILNLYRSPRLPYRPSHLPSSNLFLRTNLVVQLLLIFFTLISLFLSWGLESRHFLCQVSWMLCQLVYLSNLEHWIVHPGNLVVQIVATTLTSSCACN